MISSRLINRIVDSSIRGEKSLDSFEDSSSKTETFFFSLSKRKRKVSPNSEKIFSNSSIKSRFEKFHRRLILRFESSILRRKIEAKNSRFKNPFRSTLAPGLFDSVSNEGEMKRWPSASGTRKGSKRFREITARRLEEQPGPTQHANRICQEFSTPEKCSFEAKKIHTYIYISLVSTKCFMGMQHVETCKLIR